MGRCQVEVKAVSRKHSDIGVKRYRGVDESKSFIYHPHGIHWVVSYAAAQKP